MKGPIKLFCISMLLLTICKQTFANGNPCQPFTVTNVDSSGTSLANEFLEQTISLNPLRTVQVNEVVFQNISPTSAPYSLSCIDSTNDDILELRLRSALYWGTKTIEGLSRRVSKFFGHDFSPSLSSIRLIANIEKLDETYPASVIDKYGTADSENGVMELGIADLPSDSIFPAVLAHEITHNFHRRYLRFLGVTNANSRAFSEALADFFAMRITNTKRIKVSALSDGVGFSFERSMSRIDRYPQNIKTAFVTLKPMYQYLMQVFPLRAYPVKHRAVKQDLDWIVNNFSDPTDMRAWYWYTTGTVINQALFRVIEKHSESAEQIEKAYLSLIPDVINEDWEALVKMTRDDANEVLRASFLHAPVFAQHFLDKVEGIELRDKIKREFQRSIKGL